MAHDQSTASDGSLSRREFATSAAAAVALTAAGLSTASARLLHQPASPTAPAKPAAPALPAAGSPAAPPAPAGPFTLAPLPYAFDALEPFIDAKTMEIHHGKHHAAYVTNLNKALVGLPDFAKMSIGELLRGYEKMPSPTSMMVRNNGGGHYNHTLFWSMLKKGGPNGPSGKLMDLMGRRWDTLDKFKAEFADAGLKVFGSGWVWLVCDPKNGHQLDIRTTPNQDTPLATGMLPVFGNDVWEHAYYLKHQNKRVEYLSGWWNVLDWKAASDRYEALASGKLAE